MNRCARFARQIDDYVAGRCGPETARWMTAHTAACGGCRRAEGESREIRTAVRSAIEQVQAEAPRSETAFLSSLHARIDPLAAEPAAPWPRRDRAARGFPAWPWQRSWGIMLSAAGATVFLVALAYHFLRESARRPVLQRVARIAPDLRPRSDSPVRVTAPAARPASRRPSLHAAPSARVRARAVPTPEAAAPSPRIRDAKVPVSARTPRPAPGAVAAAPVTRHVEQPSADELAYLDGDPLAKTRRWTALSPDAWDAVEARVRRGVTAPDDFVRVPFPRLADASGRQIATAVASYRREAAVVDARLAREVTLQQKATALVDLCDRLRGETGISLVAGQSVADEKVTLFCKKLPLREVMRQLSRPFGYTWLRSGKAGEYKYELVQDLRSQLLEEELRNRDRNESLLALDREIDRYRPYLSLTPDEALARARTASPGEKPLLEKLSSWGWGSIQMYFRLSRNDLEALRTGQALRFSAQPKPGERPLPPDVARGVFQAFREWRVITSGDGFEFGPTSIVGAGGVPISSLPEARALVTVTLEQSELGQFTLGGQSAVFTTGERAKNIQSYVGQPSYAVGRSPAALKPQNAAVNARLAGDPGLRLRVTVRPQPFCTAIAVPVTARLALGAPTPEPTPQPKVSSADVLEALHRATGMPIVADFYTRLYKPEDVSASNGALFDTLNRLADTMRLRWDKEGNWLQFRSTTFYDDRLKEVPNRLLARWGAAHQQHGMLTLDDLVEIAGLPDAQLDAAEMAEGTRLCYGLAEWDLARAGRARVHLRYLAGFTPEQRQEAMSPTGLRFTRMPLAQQQRFIQLAFHPDAEPLQSLEELSEATLRVDYTQPGWFQWGDPGMFYSWTRWVVPIEPGRNGRRVVRPPVRERTREAALQAVLRLDPRVRQAAIHTPIAPSSGADPGVPIEAQIFPSELSLTFVYIPGASNARRVRISHDGMTNYQLSW
jgi:hypothetical protein